MKCHEVLEIRESATAQEIEAAYEKKICAINQFTLVGNSNLHKKKVAELTKARDDCLVWINESFMTRTGKRLSELASNLTSPNRMYEIIGPCSCIDSCCGDDWCATEDGCCHSYCCCIKKCGMYADIALYIGIGIGIIVYIGCAISDHNKKIEDKKIRLQELKNDAELQCTTIINGFFTPVTDETWNKVYDYIEKLPEYPQHTDDSWTVEQSYAIAQAQKHVDEIASEYRSSLVRRRYYDAKNYAWLQQYLSPQLINWRKAYEGLEVLCNFFDRDIPAVLGEDYGKFSDEYISGIKSYYSRNNLMSNDPASVLWGVTLSEPFDVLSYKPIIRDFPKTNYEGHPIADVLASVIYVQGKHPEVNLEEIATDYSRLLDDAIRIGGLDMLVGLASVACAAGNIKAEHRILKGLKDSRELPDTLVRREAYLAAI